MRDPMPTLNDIKYLVRKRQRRKNVIPEYAVLTNLYNQEITNLRNMQEKITDAQTLETTQLQITQLVRTKTEEENKLFQKLLEQLENYILHQPDRVRLKKHPHSTRRITSLNKTTSVQSLFDRYCSMRIANAFKIRPRGRDHCIRVLKNAIAISSGPIAAQRGIVRFDINQFFDSIPHDKIMKKLERHAGIPEYVCKHVRAILHSYRLIYNTNCGLPQGVPSSSVLAEIYLESLDATIGNDDRVALYLRYVDDVVVITEPNQANNIKSLIDKSLSAKGLETSTSKQTTTIEHPSSIQTQFEYLGYHFNFSRTNSQLESIDISEAKRDRLKNAVRRIGKYASTIQCWASPEQVNFFFQLSDYLYLTHHSKDAKDAPRILTGLGYNSRFVEGKRNKLPNFRAFIKESERQICTILNQLNAHSSVVLKCPCCNNQVHRGHELVSYRTNYLDLDSILRSSAQPHEDENERSAVKDFLWN